MSHFAPIRVILFLLGVLILSAITANASNITVAGNTEGNFDGGTTAANVSMTEVGLSILDFQGAAFSTGVTTGNPPVQVSVGAFDLRTFRLFDFDGHTFNLAVTFTAPAGAPGVPQTFTATLTGTVQVLVPSESITINFNNTPQVFAYNGGTFSFTVLDPTLNEQDGFVDIQASISATTAGGPTTPTPEPVAMLLLGTGLAGVAAKLRKRRNLKQ